MTTFYIMDAQEQYTTLKCVNIKTSFTMALWKLF